jgi:hypothetical protein
MNLDFGLCKRITENISRVIVVKKESIGLLLAVLLGDGNQTGGWMMRAR